jgi:hypothetical protein
VVLESNGHIMCDMLFDDPRNCFLFARSLSGVIVVLTWCYSAVTAAQRSCF